MANDGTGPLKQLKPGQVLWVKLLADKRIHSLRTDLDETRTLEVLRSTDDSMRVQLTRTPLDRKVRSASGVIEDSLFLSGQRAGLSDRVIMQLVEIFGWDVDFALDVRVGDRFNIIFEELYKDEEKVRDGNILAAEFVNRGRHLRGVRYTDAAGATAYFAPDGLSMRKAFLRTPVNFSRISSGFTSARRHPVLNRIRAHKGVDYAAPTGTPIKAAGNGRVSFSGWRRGYGRTVEIQHGAKYSTLYAHMSRIHERARNGRRLRQGEIIGYVGMTGLATGPHLHYEFRVNGVHQDPLRVTLPKALPIEKQYREDFRKKTRPLLAELDLLSKTSIASSD
jgi:murein DD-endopeptidase MepM/ murein hydrolase activator NlpD